VAQGSNSAPLPRTRFAATLRPLREQLGTAILELVDRISIARLFAIWLAVIVACGAAYWLIDLSSGAGLVEAGARVGANVSGLLTAIYFSFITATSVGYGDILPVGATRVLAVAAAFGGLMILGLCIAKFVS